MVQTRTGAQSDPPDLMELMETPHLIGELVNTGFALGTNLRSSQTRFGESSRANLPQQPRLDTSRIHPRPDPSITSIHPAQIPQSPVRGLNLTPNLQSGIPSVTRPLRPQHGQEFTDTSTVRIVESSVDPPLRGSSPELLSMFSPFLSGITLDHHTSEQLPETEHIEYTEQMVEG
jgi:hypothetical protein